MTFVTRLVLESGDRAVLDDVVDDIRTIASRKGAELKGPHSSPPETKRVPQYKSLEAGGDQYAAWKYTVYSREIEIVGHDEVARRITRRSFPNGVHVEVEVEQIRAMGTGNT